MPDAIAETAALFQQEIAPGSRPASGSQPGGSGKPTERVFDNLDRGVEEEEPRARKDVKDIKDVDEDFLDQLDEEPDGGQGPDEQDDDAGGDADDDADPDDDEDKEDGEDEDDDPEMNKKFAVTVDGEEVEVTLKEALGGYIRTETLHRRLNKLNEVETGLREEASTILEARDQMIEQLTEAQQLYEGAMPPEPDWDKLYTENPARARALEKSYKDVKGKIEEIKAKATKAREEQAKEQAKQLAIFAEREFPKFAQKARWKDKKHAEKDLKSMRQTAIQAGFSEEEAGSVVDHRMLHILLKASKYDRMISNKPRPVNVPGNGAGRKSSGAGNGKPRTAPKAIATAQRQHERVGSVDSAASVFEQQLALERRSRRRG